MAAAALVSTYVRFDPLHLDFDRLVAALKRLADSRDWLEAPLPEGRRLWRVPTVYGGEAGPQLEQAAAAAGVSAETAVAELSGTRVRVQALGFAPGQPYLGELPEHWNIPRLTEITPRVPAAALIVAIRQLVVFTAPNSTGWRHVGQTALPLFRPEADDPFTLRPGDEALFEPVSAEEFVNRRKAAFGGAVAEAL